MAVWMSSHLTKDWDVSATQVFTHRQVDIGDPLLAGDLRKVEGEDEVDVVGRPAHHEYRHHHPEHLHLKNETCRIWPSGVVFLCFLHFPLKCDSIDLI